MKEKIMDAAARLFAERGYHKTSIDDIAAAADIAKGSVYYHFKNKSQLFAETVIWGIDFLKADMIRAKDSWLPFQEIAQKFISILVHAAAENGSIVDTVMMDITDGIDEGAAEDIRKARGELIGVLAQSIREAMAIGAIRPCTPDAAACAVLHFVYSYCRSAENADPNRIEQEISRLLMHGMVC